MNKIKISPEPPQIEEHHVRLPGQVATLLGASSLHDQGITGAGVRVAVIDSGFFQHPYYSSRGYDIEYIPTRKEKNPHIDEYGHGTAQLASLLAMSPGIKALVIKCMDRDPSYALEKALDAKPHVLSCAWGFNIDRPETKRLPAEYRRMHRLVLKAIDLGVTVVAAAGNGQFAFPGSMPEVIAAGGVYYGPDGGFYPSDVSSKFTSTLFPGRQVPDVCGLVGNRPHGRLLLVPVPPRAKLAERPAFSTIAAGRSSDIENGWAIFSGTSAATAMISGAVALLLQKKPGLKPAQIKAALMAGSIDVACRTLKEEKHSRLLNVTAALQKI